MKDEIYTYRPYIVSINQSFIQQTVAVVNDAKNSDAIWCILDDLTYGMDYVA